MPKMNKAYKFRIYPHTKQREMFAKTFGCARFIYNKMLEDKINYYKECGKMLHNTPAMYKTRFPWLKEVDSMALCNAQIQLQGAYNNFFRGQNVGFPNFRSKHKSCASYTTNLINGNIRLENGYLKLPKVGCVKIVQHRQIPDGYVIKSVTVSQEPSGKYYASILTEYEADMPELTLEVGSALGLDYSSPHFYVDSNGASADMPHFFREAEKKLAREQRRLSRMTKGGKNWKKQKKRIALLHERIRNQRKDWQHKRSRELADKHDIICVEDIDYHGMAQSLKLGKSTNDNAFGQFRTFLSYKMTERGKKLITIDKWFASSRTCRHCGNMKADLTLADRTWVCPCCGTEIDRDINAAINIRNKGLCMLSA